MLKIKKVSKIKYLVLFCAVLIIAGLVILYYTNDRGNNLEQPTPTSGQTEKINLSPPTTEDTKGVEANKEKNISRDEQINNQPIQEPGTKKTVKPTITYSGQYGNLIEVGGYVSDVFEDGGVCTATFARESTSFSKSVTSVKNINSVDCPVMSAQKSEFNQIGKWYVTVSYDSSTASGKSDVREIEVK